jgi:hypothetical protein
VKHPHFTHRVSARAVLSVIPVYGKWHPTPNLGMKSRTFIPTSVIVLSYPRLTCQRTVMVCSVWNKLHAEFLRIARAIEKTDTCRPRGAERNKELNAAARESVEKLHQHEREHGCKPSNEELKADGKRRWREAQQRVEARRGKQTGRG